MVGPTTTGLLHLLDRDMTTLCGCPYGLITGSVARCTCTSCIAIWDSTCDVAHGRPLAVGRVRTVSH